MNYENEQLRQEVETLRELVRIQENTLNEFKALVEKLLSRGKVLSK